MIGQFVEHSLHADGKPPILNGLVLDSVPRKLLNERMDRDTLRIEINQRQLRQHTERFRECNPVECRDRCRSPKVRSLVAAAYEARSEEPATLER